MRPLTCAILTLAVIAFDCVASAQNVHPHAAGTPKADWKDYKYPEYGFVVTLPHAPTEAGVTDGIQLRLYWNENWDADKGVVLNVTTKRGPTDCDAWIKWERDTITKFSSATFHNLPVTASRRIVMLDGSPAVEGDAMRNAIQAGYQRHQCLNGRLYSFEAGFPKGQEKPEIVDEILKTFRILSKESEP